MAVYQKVSLWREFVLVALGFLMSVAVMQFIHKREQPPAEPVRRIYDEGNVG